MVLPCLMSAFNSIGGSCFGWAGERIKAEAAYLIAYAENIENLRKNDLDLSDAIKALTDRIEEAANRGETLVVPAVDRLLKRMASLQEEASKIITDEEQSSDSRCLMGLRPNLWACYLTSKSAKKAIDEATKLLEEEHNFVRPVANVDPLEPLAVPHFEEFEEFESRVLVKNHIVVALKDPSVNKVGMYGMGGAGKTTLAEKIGEILQLDSTFKYVVLATVSEKQNQLENNYKPDLLNVQKQIAGGLKIRLQGANLRDRAAELHKQLQKKDKVLIILDDIWSRFELKDVGIPTYNVQKNFKILMTSRNEMVLRKEMDSTRNFGLDSLPFHDAWFLFDRMVGGDGQYSNWRSIAEQVVEQCGGIPILLVTIARALRNEDLEIWEDALTQLTQFDGKDIVEEAYKRIEVSYKFLKNEEKMKLLLLCAQLNHRSIPVEELLKYAIGLDLFQGCETVKHVRGRLQKYLGDLKGCCLLQGGSEEGIIKMHDVVHKFATFVAARDHGVFSVANDGELKRWPSKEQFEKFRAISFFYCRLPSDHELPVGIDNPYLESFLMLGSDGYAPFIMPNNFFVGMKGLKLMDLRNMCLSPVLVSSLGALVKLRTLCLDKCELSDISVIGELRNLQVLSLVGSSIDLVPKEIGELGSTLKQLDLRDCFKLETIASGVISRLTLLENLRIGKSFMSWERLEGNDKSNNSVGVMYDANVASLEEFKNLQNLINLEIYIPEYAKMFPKDLVFTKLETFTIFIGNLLASHHLLEINDYVKYMLPRTLVLDESLSPVEFDSEGSKALMRRAESLLLARIMGSVTVCELDRKGFPQLKHLKVGFENAMFDSGDDLQYIVKNNYNNCIFQKLETLDLLCLSKLERICDDHDHPLPIGSFENLRVLEVSWCDLLKDLLSFNFARGLLSLTEIRVNLCRSMENIIVSRESENEEEIKIKFTHQLRILKLGNLPRLMSFYSFKQLEKPPSTTPFFNKKIMFPKLEVLELIDMRIEKIWDDYIATTAEGICSFQNLTSLEIHSCDKLKYLFTSFMVKILAQLKQFEVSDCESIEEIVSTMRKGEIEGEKLLLFPKLESLELKYLPKLKIFCHANLLECQSLQTLKIKDCPMLKAFNGDNESTPDPATNSRVLFDKKIIFPKLEVLELCKMKIEKIWDDYLAIIAEGTLWFQNLTSLEVSYCDNLSHLFTSSMAKSLPQLKELEVDECDSIEEIVATTREAEMEGEKLLFPKLESLRLSGLPKLKRFCHANSLECQSLRKLRIINCPLLSAFTSTNDSTTDLGPNSITLFHQKILFPKLEKLYLSEMKIEKIWDVDHLAIEAEETTCWFQSLTKVEVSQCDNLSYLFTSSMVTSLAELKQLKVSECESIEEIVVSSTARDIQLSFPKLYNIELKDLPNFKRFCQANLLECQLLEKLVIKKCSELKAFMSVNDSSTPVNSTTLFSEKVAFSNMDELEITDCPSLTSICPASLVPTTLQKLERLDVQNCDRIDLFGFNSTQQLYDTFAKLISSLKSCNLINGGMKLRIAYKSVTLQIGGCGFQVPPLLFALLKSFPKLDEVEVSECSIIQLFPCKFDHMGVDTQAKSLARIGHLKLTNLSNMKQIWSEHSPVNYHGILEVLEVTQCDSLLSLAPPSSTLFKNLTDLKVYGCDKLTRLFTSSMVKSLSKLKQLEVNNCESIEEIVASSTERETAGDIQLSFPKLDNIELRHLPKLKRFCEANLLECELLEELVILGCPELKTFVSANDSSNSDNNSKTLFTEKVAFPNIEELKIANCDSLEKVFDVQILPMGECRILPFENFRSVVVSYCPSLTSIFPACLVSTSLQQLEKLKVQNCDKIDLVGLSKVISSSKYCKLDFGGLKLRYENQRFKLKIGWCGFQVPPILFDLLKKFPELDQIEVSNDSIIELFPCDNLLGLAVPSTTLFINLTALIVWGCTMLIKLVASSSIAKSFVNLKEMRVGCCDSLEEIIIIDDQWDKLGCNDECIVFEKLEVLELTFLETLTSFCSTSHCNFRFPSLDRVIVDDCPKMKFFCKGALSTPKLIRVVVEDDEEGEENEGRWEGDLNSTIRQLFEEMEMKMEEEEEVDMDEDDDSDEQENEVEEV